jgi:hypothetical protein
VINSTRNDGVYTVAQHIHLGTCEWFDMVFEVLRKRLIAGGQPGPDTFMKPIGYAVKTIAMVAFQSVA